MNRFLKNNPIFIFIPIICYFLFMQTPIMPWKVYADVPDMEMNATPNPVGSGARALGIGGAFISIADDATAASWNPGGLLHLKRPEISIVGALFSGKNNYNTSGVNGDIEDRSSSIHHLNYFSAAIPIYFKHRNFVFSVNYQHLYEFFQENFSTWIEPSPLPMTDVTHKDYKYQKGSLFTVSPALAAEIVPSFFLGLACNFWDHDILDNGWENLTVQIVEGMDSGLKKISRSEIYEKYDLSGVNIHIGFLFKSDYHTLWGKKGRFRIGGVLKTPFKADIRHERREILYERYPENPNQNKHKESVSPNDLQLKMPISYGLGFSLDFSDNFLMALDVYHTRWDQYVLVYPSGAKYSPINKQPRDEANIKATTQLRLGAEYLLFYHNHLIPVRTGIFYDPEPSKGNSDDFYGTSIGIGILFQDFSFDIAYQYRFGKRKKAAFMDFNEISAKIKQHITFMPP